MDAHLKLGAHYIVDLSHCDHELLFNSDRCHELFSTAVREAGLTVVNEGIHRFAPHGFTCFLVLAESHASLHTWPEHSYCAIDLFTCNLTIDLNPLVQTLKSAFGAAECSTRIIGRYAESEVIQAEIPVTLPLEVAVAKKPYNRPVRALGK